MSNENRAPSPHAAASRRRADRSRPAAAGAPRGPRASGAAWALGLLAFLVFAAFLIGLGLIGYAVVAGSLPPPAQLEDEASNFQTTRIYDREGNLLNADL